MYFSVLSCLKLQFEVKENTDLGKAIDPQMTVSSERSNDIEKNFTAKKNCAAFSVVCIHILR